MDHPIMNDIEHNVLCIVAFVFIIAALGIGYWVGVNIGPIF